MLRKLTLGLLLSVAALSASALPPGITKPEFCEVVAKNVRDGFEAKSDTKPEDLDQGLFIYAVRLHNMGFSADEIEQVVKAVQTGYNATKNVEGLAKAAEARCLDKII